MPNHCESDLRITGPRPRLEEFLNGCRTIDDKGEPRLDMCAGHHPMPASFVGVEASSSTEQAWAAKFGDQRSLDYWLNMPWAPECGIKDRNSLLVYAIGIDKTAADQAEKRHHNIKTYGCPTWYEWCIQNYGTKWGDYETTQEWDGDTLVLHFRTAWSPPLVAMKHISAKWTDLTFEIAYFEQGAGFQGSATYAGGAELNAVRTNDYEGDRGG